MVSVYHHTIENRDAFLKMYKFNLDFSLGIIYSTHMYQGKNILIFNNT